MDKKTFANAYAVYAYMVIKTPYDGIQQTALAAHPNRQPYMLHAWECVAMAFAQNLAKANNRRKNLSSRCSNERSASASQNRPPWDLVIPTQSGCHLHLAQQPVIWKPVIWKPGHFWA